MRKLASVREVKKLIPIKGADRIELAQVDGWFCIVKKGEFTTGDLGVYFEIDSLLPCKEPYLFLGKPKTYNGVDAYRIKTMKMRGVISQGLLLPTRYFKELSDVSLGDDVTDILGITKYEAGNFNGNNGGSSKVSTSKGFPDFIPKTDQERIQNIPYVFEEMKDVQFEETLKLDGSSYTAYKIESNLPWYKRLINKVYPTFSTTTFAVCSRNIELTSELDRPYEEMSNFYKVTVDNSVNVVLPVGYAIQGELIAPNIQSNHEKVVKPELYIFDVFDIEKQKKLLPTQRREFVASIGLNHIPVINPNFTMFDSFNKLEDLLNHVEGESINPNTISEGRVYKSVDSDFSFKVISNQYLLKER